MNGRTKTDLQYYTSPAATSLDVQSRFTSKAILRYAISRKAMHARIYTHRFKVRPRVRHIPSVVEIMMNLVL